MADTIEKVYCTGDGGNDNLAAALLARGRDNDPATMLAAKALMGASGYVAYVAKHGYHFTKQLAIKASEQMKNVDGTSHRWTVDEIRLATNNEIISKGATIGDILYLANMAYADFYPKVIKTESDCVQYAIAVASDPDGYEGMAFCRWTADIIGKGVTIDWEKLE